MKAWIVLTVVAIPVALGAGVLLGSDLGHAPSPPATVAQSVPNIPKPVPPVVKVDRTKELQRDMAQVKGLGATASISFMSCYSTVHLDTIMRDYSKSFSDQASCAAQAKGDLESQLNETKEMLASDADSLRLLADWYSSWLTSINSVADMPDFTPAQTVLDGKLNALLTHIQFET